MLYAILIYIFTQADRVIAMATATLEKPKKAKGAKKAPSKAAPKRTAAKKNAPNAGALSPAKTVQMNVRIDEDLKEAGDIAFARIGLTPSQAVRLLWDYAARHANDPQTCSQLVEMLDEEPPNGSASSEREQRLETLHKGWALIDDFRREHNLTCTVPEDDDERMAYYEQLREEALWERLAERGLQ